MARPSHDPVRARRRPGPSRPARPGPLPVRPGPARRGESGRPPDSDPVRRTSTQRRGRSAGRAGGRRGIASAHHDIPLSPSQEMTPNPGRCRRIQVRRGPSLSACLGLPLSDSVRASSHVPVFAIPLPPHTPLPPQATPTPAGQAIRPYPWIRQDALWHTWESHIAVANTAMANTAIAGAPWHVAPFQCTGSLLLFRC